MNKNLIAAVFAAFVLAGCNFNAIHGSGNVITESRNVAGFTAVDLSGTGHLIIEENGTESLTITAEDNLMPLLTSEVQGDRLVLGIKPMSNIDPTREIVYKVSARNLNGIEVSGMARIDAQGIRSPAFKVSVSGAAKISVEGSADRQDVELSGASSYNAEGLRTKETKVSISGAAGAIVAVSDRLDAEISGAGTVKYIGNPAITQQVSGAGSIHQMN